MKLFWLKRVASLNDFWVYLRRRKQRSYISLWEDLYGDNDQGKGLYREYDFLQEVAGMWASEAKRLKKELDGKGYGER
jgi:hypothetical protein